MAQGTSITVYFIGTNHVDAVNGKPFTSVDEANAAANAQDDADVNVYEYDAIVNVDNWGQVN